MNLRHKLLLWKLKWMNISGNFARGNGWNVQLNIFCKQTVKKG